MYKKKSNPLSYLSHQTTALRGNLTGVRNETRSLNAVCGMWPPLGVEKNRANNHFLNYLP